MSVNDYVDRYTEEDTDLGNASDDDDNSVFPNIQDDDSDLSSRTEKTGQSRRYHNASYPRDSRSALTSAYTDDGQSSISTHSSMPSSFGRSLGGGVRFSNGRGFKGLRHLGGVSFDCADDDMTPPRKSKPSLKSSPKQVSDFTDEIDHHDSLGVSRSSEDGEDMSHSAGFPVLDEGTQRSSKSNADSKIGRVDHNSSSLEYGSHRPEYRGRASGPMHDRRHARAISESIVGTQQRRQRHSQTDGEYSTSIKSTGENGTQTSIRSSIRDRSRYDRSDARRGLPKRYESSSYEDRSYSSNYEGKRRSVGRSTSEIRPRRNVHLRTSDEYGASTIDQGNDTYRSIRSSARYGSAKRRETSNLTALREYTDGQRADPHSSSSEYRPCRSDPSARPMHGSTASMRQRSNGASRSAGEYNSSVSTIRRTVSDEGSRRHGSIRSSRTNRSNNDRNNRVSKQKPTSKAERFNTTAADLLSKGRNEEALEAYRRAMHCARDDMMRVKKMIQRVHKHKKRGKEDPNKSGEIEALEKKLNKNLLAISATIADILNNIGVVYEMDGNYDAAISSCAGALDVYKNTCNRYENSNDPDVDRTVKNIKQMELAKSTQEKRKQLHSQADQLAERARRETAALTRKELEKEVLTLLRKALSLEKDNLGVSHPTVAKTLIKIGQYHIETNNFSSGMKEINAAIKILRCSLGNNHPDVGRALLTMAIILDERNMSTMTGEGSASSMSSDKDAAIRIYKDALKPLRASLGDTHHEVGWTYNNIGVIHHQNGHYDLAMEAFLNALKGYGEKGIKKDETIHPDAAYVWSNIGEIHMRWGEWEESLTAYQSALDVLLKLKRAEKANSDNTADKDGRNSSKMIASTMRNIGKAHIELAMYDKAMEVYSEVIRLYRADEMLKYDAKSEMQSESFDEDMDSSTEIARVYECMGLVQMHLGNITKAMDLYLQALNIFRSINTIQGSIDVASVLRNIGWLHLKKQEYEEAEAVLSEALNLYDRNGIDDNDQNVRSLTSMLMDAEAGVMGQSSSSAERTMFHQHHGSSSVHHTSPSIENEINAAIAMENRAESLSSRGDYDGAIRSYSEALAVRREYAMSESSVGKESNKQQIGIGRTLCKIARLHEIKREFEQSQVFYDEALRLFKMNGLSDTHPFVREISDKFDCSVSSATSRCSF